MTDLDRIKSLGGVVQKKTPRQKSRDGLRGLLTYHSPEAIKQLKMVCAEQDKNQQQLLAEALNYIFMKYGKSPIA